jgi:hypothetical protein
MSNREQMQITNIGVLVTLDGVEGVREVMLNKDQRYELEKFLVSLCDPLKISDEILNGIEIIHEKETK